MKNLLATVAMVTFATPALAETFATITDIRPNYQEVTSNQPIRICNDVEVPIYGNTGGSGASGADVLGGMIIGGLLGKGVTGKDNGAAAGAVLGGIIAADQNQGQRGIVGYKREKQCYTENRYTTERVIKNYTIRYEWRGFVGKSFTFDNYNVGDRVRINVSINAK